MTAFEIQTPASGLAHLALGDIAARLPGATAVLRDARLDFCCGGDQSLADAAAKRGLDLAALTARLAALDPAARPEAPETTGPLIDHILDRFHETHRRELPELIRLARKVEAVHAGHPDRPAGLADLLTEMAAELESHMRKEELILFPLMKSGGNPMIAHPIGRMRFEHDEHAARIRALGDLTHDASPPEGACRSWQALYSGIAKLIDDLMLHIHLENNVLFPRFAPDAAPVACCAGR